MSGTVGIVFGYRAAQRVAFHIDVGPGPHGHDHLRAVGVENDVARPVRVVASGGQVEDFLGKVFGLCLTGPVPETDHGIGIGHIEVIAPESHAEGPVESGLEGEPCVRDAFAQGVTQDEDGPRPRVGEKDVAIRRQGHPARLFESALGVNADLEAGRQVELSAGRTRNHPRRIRHALGGEGSWQSGQRDLVVSETFRVDLYR